MVLGLAPSLYPSRSLHGFSLHHGTMTMLVFTWDVTSSGVGRCVRVRIGTWFTLMPALCSQRTPATSRGGSARARERADAFDTMRDGFRVERIEGGHCVQDDSPDAVARALLRWLPQVQAWASRE